MGMTEYSVVESGNVGLGQVGSAVLDNGESIASLGTVSYTHLTLPTTPYV